MVVAALDTVGVDGNASVVAGIGAVGTAAAGTVADAAETVDFGY
jgi:hypothetical protein